MQETGGAKAQQKSSLCLYVCYRTKNISISGTALERLNLPTRTEPMIYTRINVELVGHREQCKYAFAVDSIGVYES